MFVVNLLLSFFGTLLFWGGLYVIIFTVLCFKYTDIKVAKYKATEIISKLSIGFVGASVLTLGCFLIYKGIM